MVRLKDDFETVAFHAIASTVFIAEDRAGAESFALFLIQGNERLINYRDDWLITFHEIWSLLESYGQDQIKHSLLAINRAKLTPEEADQIFTIIKPLACHAFENAVHPANSVWMMQHAQFVRMALGLEYKNNVFA